MSHEKLYMESNVLRYLQCVRHLEGALKGLENSDSSKDVERYETIPLEIRRYVSTMPEKLRTHRLLRHARQKLEEGERESDN